MHLVPTGIRIDRVWESHREWITVDDEVYDEQISFHSMLARLKTDLVNMAHIKEPPSILNTTIHSVYSDLKKARVNFGQKKSDKKKKQHNQRTTTDMLVSLSKEVVLEQEAHPIDALLTRDVYQVKADVSGLKDPKRPFYTYRLLANMYRNSFTFN